MFCTIDSEEQFAKIACTADKLSSRNISSMHRHGTHTHTHGVILNMHSLEQNSSHNNHVRLNPGGTNRNTSDKQGKFDYKQVQFPFLLASFTALIKSSVCTRVPPSAIILHTEKVTVQQEQEREHEWVITIKRDEQSHTVKKVTFFWPFLCHNKREWELVKRKWSNISAIFRVFWPCLDGQILVKKRSEKQRNRSLGISLYGQISDRFLTEKK